MGDLLEEREFKVRSSFSMISHVGMYRDGPPKDAKQKCL